MTNKEISDYRAAIGHAVRTYRTKKGYSQTQLTMATGIAQTVLSKIESRGQPFTLVTAYRLAHALDCTVHDLIPATSRDVVAGLTADLAEVG